MALTEQLLMEAPAAPAHAVDGGGGAPPDARRWAVLLAFSANCGVNAFMFMDFTTVPTLTKQVFGFCPTTGNATACDGVGDEFVGWTYSASLLAVVPTVIAVMALVESHAWATYTATFGAQAAGAWLRYVAVHVAATGDTGMGKDLALLSAVLLGVGSAGCVVSSSAVAAEWFPAPERALATSCTVQSNYAGWALGAVVFPYSVASVQDLVDLQFMQAIGVSIAFGTYLMVYQERDGDDGAGTGQQQSAQRQHPGFVEGMHMLATSRQYILQCLCYSCMAGVSFAVPAFQASASVDLQHPNAFLT